MTLTIADLIKVTEESRAGVQTGDPECYEYFTGVLEALRRLAAIEAAGDEEVESLHESFYKLLPLNTLEARRCGAFDTAIELLQERNATIAELRAKLGEQDAEIRNLLNQIDHMKRVTYEPESEVEGG